MVRYEEIIAKTLNKATEIDEKELETYIEFPKDKANGDYALPCFKLAKTMKKAPQIIANEIKEKMEINEKYIEKVEVVGGYINFFVNKENLAEEVLEEISKEGEYGKAKIGEGRKMNMENLK